MPQNITDVDAFTDPIVIPADADPADLTYIETLAQGLANRTRHLYNLLPTSRPIYIYATAAVREDPTQWQQIAEPTVSGRIKAIADSARVRWTLSPGSNFPWKGTITAMHANVKPGEARVDPPDRVTLRIYTVQVDGTITLARTSNDDGSNAYQSLPSSGSLAIAFDGDVGTLTNINQIIVTLDAGVGIGTPGVPNDLVDFLRVAVTAEQL